jgi:hypothetical protein
MSKKFTTVKVSGVIIQVAETTDIEGYTIGVIESMLPTDEELSKMTQKQQDKWVKKNNIRMEAICTFMNNFNVQ